MQAYVDRAGAYNGACTQLVTLDGAPVPSASGPVRAGSPVRFPTSTVPVSSILPDFDRYAGVPLDLGRMEPTRSDPTVQAQYGMVAGVPGAGQVNALSTLNLRGERSVSCRGACDAHPSTGELPADCPAACDVFRRQPDALERAAELDARYGDDPIWRGCRLYCVPLAFKDVYDTKDMRTTTGADIDFALTCPPPTPPSSSGCARRAPSSTPRPTPPSSTAASGTPAGPPPRAPGTSATRSGARGAARLQPYDTARSPRGSSSGSGVAVSANLAVCAFCEQTGGSCKGPASRNGVVSLLTTKGLIPYGGAVGSNRWWTARASIAAPSRTPPSCSTPSPTPRSATSIRGTSIPRCPAPRPPTSPTPASSSKRPPSPGEGPPLAGLRIGIVREYMVRHTLNDAAISDQIDEEIKTVLRDRLGATLVESRDPLHPDDPAVPDMAYTFQDALAETLPIHLPEYFHKTTRTGALEFAVPGHDVTSTRYLVELAEGRAPLAPNLNLRRVTLSPPSRSFAFHIDQYLARRGDERVTDRASLDAHTKYFSAAAEAGSANWAALDDVRAYGNTERMQMRAVMQIVLGKVMRENRLDVLVNPENTLPHQRVGGPSEPTATAGARRGRPRPSPRSSGLPRSSCRRGSTTSSTSPGTS